MASVGHIAVGLAAARVYHHGHLPRWPAAVAWSALSLLPDTDVIGFSLGVEYGDPWGHRGATHSLTLSLAIGLAIGFAAYRLKRPAAPTAFFAGLVLASHGILDTMTDGGLGCALFWPFSLTRYFAPWRPIPVAPIGLDFLSTYGAIIAVTELVLFAPVLLVALRPRPLQIRPVAAGFFLVLWLASVWVIESGDPVREAIVGFVLREDTAFSQGFSEEAFRAITPGVAEAEVRARLGQPFGESWFYTSGNQRAMTAAASSIAGCRAVHMENGIVESAFDVVACRKNGIETGTSQMDVKRLLGSPTESCWQYSWSPRHAHHRMRMLCFWNARVETVFRRWN